MNGWQGLFSVPGVPSPGSLGNMNTGPGGWPGFSGNIPPVVPPAGPIMGDAFDNFFVNRDIQARNFSMPQGVQPTGWYGANTMPGAGGGPKGNGGWLGIEGLGRNIGTAQLALGTLGGIANVWNGMQQNKLAKRSFEHQRGLLDTNLANQIKAFNLQLDDKLRSRQVVEGTSDAAREEARKRWEARDERRG